MSKRIFAKEQIASLLKNPNVARCSEKSISYANNFKARAVREWQTGISPQEIFINAGFNINMTGSETPKDCLRRWRKIFDEKGERGLKVDSRGQSKAGGRRKRNWQSDKDKIDYLEAEVAYLKAENDFLAKLRKKS